MTKHIIVGTAGHVGHGKTTLVGFLAGPGGSGEKSEKSRGRTVESSVVPLGFEDDLAITLVDVPGHERYLKNTIRGLCGVETALLVIAADDGVMPRTVEHLRILEFLGVEHGFTVLSKCDLVDEETVELAQLEIRETVAGTFLENQPILPYSAGDEKSLGKILLQLETVARRIAAKPKDGPFRLWIDRICGFSGHGTVVCGTVKSGQVREGDALELLPGNLKSRARSLEIHRGKVQTAAAGQQVGINIPKTSQKSVKRGMMLAAPESLNPSRFLNATLRISKDAGALLANHRKVLLYIGTRVSFAQVVLMEKEAIEPGEEGLAQLRLSEEIPALPGDRFVVTPHCEKKVLGGGTVLEASLFKFRGGRAKDTVAYLKALAKEDLPEAALAYMRLFPYRPSVPEEMAKYSGRSVQKFEDALRDNENRGKALRIGERAYCASDRFIRLKEETLAAAESLLEKDLQKETFNPEELRTRLSPKMDKLLFHKILESLQDERKVFKEESEYRFPGIDPQLSQSRAIIAERLMEYGKGKGLSPFSEGQFQESSERPFPKGEIQQVAGYLVKRKRLIRLGDGRLLTSQALEQVKARVKDSISRSGEFTLADCKTILGFGRTKGSIIFDYLDEIGFTRRDGNRRFVV